MSGGGYAVFGQIPGSVYSFLHVDNALLPDPYWRENERIYTELTENEFVFEREFDCPCFGGNVSLVMEGLDTLCSVYLNGECLGETNNMHLRYAFDVRGKLRKEGNCLRVVCHSVNDFIRRTQEDKRLFGAVDCMDGYPHVRKAHSMMGWDWGPQLPDAGIWRSVYLLEKNSAELGEVCIEQFHENGEVFVSVQVESDGGDVEICAVAPNGKSILLAPGTKQRIENPQLWWPNGLGEQPLYEIVVRLKEGGEVVDERREKIGLRSLKLVRKEDAFGESFYHEVNGIPVFAKGADYIPEDNIFSRITKERTRTLLTHCKACHFNAIRVWGGGYYPDDWFFELCDELGLLVFFDCMFACSLYDPDAEMFASIEEELTQNLMRIRHHASLALLCGNNEIEWHFHEYVALAGRTDRAYLEGVYLDLFERRIPRIVETVAPWIAYIPSSPTSGGRFANPNGEESGDCHDWETDFSSIRGKFYRYVSEFGFQAFPCEKTVKTFALEEDKAPFSPVMKHRQRSGGGTELIISQLQKFYPYPQEFSLFAYATQLLQAQSVRYRVEHFRRHRGRCMGTLYWQLNDIWPAISWASIDYCGRYKALQYAAKRFYAPVLVSCEEAENRMRLCVTNDTLESVHGMLKWSICGADGVEIYGEETPMDVPALTSTWQEQITLPTLCAMHQHVRYCFVVDGEVVSEGCTLFVAPKEYAFVAPMLQASIQGDEIVLISQAFASQVEIEGVDGDLLLEDNYFDMERGEKRVRILSGKATAVRVRSVYDLFEKEGAV